MKTRIVVPHKKNCGALDMANSGIWKTPWATITPETKQLNAWGTNKGQARRHYWLQFRCNSIDCPALILVSVDDICAELPTGAKP